MAGSINCYFLEISNAIISIDLIIILGRQFFEEDEGYYLEEQMLC